MKRQVVLSLLMFTAAGFLVLPGTPCGCAIPARGQAERIVNTARGLKLRQGPDINSSIILTIPNGMKVSVLETGDREIEIDGVRGTWSRIGYGNVIGWVFAGQFLEPNEISVKDIAGRSFFFSPDEVDGASTTGFAVEADGSFYAECNLRGNGRAKIEGTYNASFRNGAANLAVQGTAEGIYLTGKEKRLSKTFTDGEVIIWKKEGVLRGTFRLPICSPIIGKKLE
ncbi:MAG TPA: SH3 domain-containing protein [Spirochaetota bacterium]|nr:SH3 domain-containing protein [Spirochaetota bacterium]HOD14997.1 SH3 domain-containing protein [Spirochaetota bacterium]HPG49499.1 SH3 domain-containing protein [Spirochaetota bacterium]HPN11528.1 SH3 domain-containing protein [Spirochaetota bacterium]HQL82698.1 SH3 domain-containing protein [Spirochaetota bacterium]